jgi:acetyl-CoA C-acetyltransferase
MNPASFVHGVAVSVSWRLTSASLTDLIFRATTAALRDSNIDLERIDSVVLSAHDLVDGRSLSSMVTAPAAGAYLRDEIRLAEDGLAAMSLAGARIAAGEAEFSIVAAWGRASEGSYSYTSRHAFDPFLVQPFGVDEFSVSALRLSAWIGEHGEHLDARRRAHRARVVRAAHNPRAIGAHIRPVINHPMMDFEAPRLADIVVVAVIGRAESAVRIAGVGHSSDVSMIGDRKWLQMQATRDAVARARPPGAHAAGGVDVYQLAGPTLADEALALEAVQVAPSGGGFDAYAALAAVNPSGGSESGWCFPTSGLLNFAECYLQLDGRAGSVQLPGRLRRALATGLSPMGGQVAHAIFLEAT